MEILWGLCFSSRSKAWTASVFGGWCLWGCLLTQCVSVCVVLSQGLWCIRAVGFLGLPQLLCSPFWTRVGGEISNSSQLFSFFFKPRRNMSHERDWLKWLQSSPRKVRMTISPKQCFKRKSIKSKMFLQLITENQRVYTFKIRNLLNNWLRASAAMSQKKKILPLVQTGINCVHS